MIFEDNGILKNAIQAKNKIEVQTLKEEIEMELLTICYDSEGDINKLTVSEKVDKLIENELLNDDLIFKSNNNYKFSYSGDILNNATGHKEANVDLYANNIMRSTEVQASSSTAVGNRVVKVIDGDVINEENRPTAFSLVPNDPPNGYKFAYWMDAYNNIVSFQSNPILATITDQTYIPIYVKNDIIIETIPTCSIYITNQCKEGKYLISACGSSGLNEVDRLDFDFVVGVCVTNNLDLANEDFLLATKSTDTSSPGSRFANSYAVISNSASDGLYACSVSIASWTPSYFRGYVKLINKNSGEESIYYSKNIMRCY